MDIPRVDCLKQRELTRDQIAFFEAKGFLVLRNTICAEELEALRSETAAMISAMDADRANPDYWWNDEMPKEWYRAYGDTQLKPEPSATSAENGQGAPEVKRGVPFRIEYPVDKSLSCRRLLGHAFISRAIQQLIKSPNYIPTWDSFVFKMPGEGVPIKWHRDASMESVDSSPAIDIGYYLDTANVAMGNCLWAIPGSQKWPDFLAAQMIDHLTNDGFKTSGAVPIEVEPGDCIFHNILVLHGSLSSTSPLRRTVYFEYRAISQELKMGPHTPEYIPLKQKVFQVCLHERSLTTFDGDHGGHERYEYAPTDPLSVAPYDPSNRPSTLRYPHRDYFRKDYKG